MSKKNGMNDPKMSPYGPGDKLIPDEVGSADEQRSEIRAFSMTEHFQDGPTELFSYVIGLILHNYKTYANEESDTSYGCQGNHFEKGGQCC